MKNRLFLAAIAALIFTLPVLASENEIASHGGAISLTFLWLAVILVAAKIGGMVAKFGQPAVLGELVFGIILGNLPLLGLRWFESIGANDYIKFLAELGVVVLLFKVGLESNINKMKKVGSSAFLVASMGVICPFVLGTWVIGPLLFSDMSFHTHLFLGATLTATSVGITARIFSDLKKSKLPESQVILGAAVIDDVLGLIILAVVSSIIITGGVTWVGILWITVKALTFLVGAIAIGDFSARHLGKLFSKIYTGTGMKMVFSLIFMLLGTYLASIVGLAPIIGAFAAGLVLDSVHFKDFRRPRVIEDLQTLNLKLPTEFQADINKVLEYHSKKHIEDYIKDVGYLLMPVFFILTGFNVRLEALFNLQALWLALIVTAIAIVGKLISGLGVRKSMNRWLVGIGMIPRGEVGLIFAAIGQSIGVLTSELYSIIVMVVILTTLISPPLLTWLLKRHDAKLAVATATI